jgi:hypothetical protein
MYQPVMSEENVRRLYFLKLEKRRPMTKLLDTILNQYFEKPNRQKAEAGEGGEGRCMNANSAETPSKSNGRRKGKITTISDTGTAPSAETSMTS